MKKPLLPLLALGLLPLCAAPRARAQPAGRALLAQMVAAEARVQCSGVINVAHGNAPAMTMRFWRSGNARRLEWLEPSAMRGDLLVDDGVTVWTYHHSDNSALQTHRASAEGAAELLRADRSYTVKSLGAQSVAGRPAWVVEMVRADADKPERKYWIDQATGMRLRAQRWWRGASTSCLSVQSIAFAPVSPNLFRWKSPPGARLTRTDGVLYNQLWEARRAAVWLKVPGFVPAGYYFESAVVDPSGKAWMRYTDGAHPLSIFQERSEGPDKAARHVSPNAWFWQHDDNRFLVVGAPDGKGQEMADSLR